MRNVEVIKSSVYSRLNFRRFTINIKKKNTQTQISDNETKLDLIIYTTSGLKCGTLEL